MKSFWTEDSDDNYESGSGSGSGIDDDDDDDEGSGKTQTSRKSQIVFTQLLFFRSRLISRWDSTGNRSTAQSHRHDFRNASQRARSFEKWSRSGAQSAWRSRRHRTQSRDKDNVGLFIEGNIVARETNHHDLLPVHRYGVVWRFPQRRCRWFAVIFFKKMLCDEKKFFLM